ncbi:MAG: hypothetical protein J5938_05060 [Clostridia bacterium]|nr:hypothetical protein [Clostridia bacterium]
MVKKLYRYEFISMFRSLGLFYAVLLGISILGRLIQFFESDTIAYSIVFRSTLFFFAVGCIVLLVVTVIQAIRRFYMNLYSSEGYISFLLPVTRGQHIRVKLITALVFTLFSILVCLASAAIMMGLDLTGEVFKAIGYVLGEIIEGFGVANFVFYLLEGIVLVVLAFAVSYMQLYSCLSIGQLAKKRILAAVGVYFAYYVIGQILSTVLLIFLFLNPWLQEWVLSLLGTHAAEALHIWLLALIVFQCLLFVLFSILTYLPMKKKLNLE